MIFALSTHWNASRHSDGEAMIQEILDMGIDHVELGYDTRIDLVPGIKTMVDQGAVKINSVHNFCPVPIGAPQGHPELFTLASSDRRIRESAVEHIGRTIAFAAEVGAKAVVTHAGNVEMKHFTLDLLHYVAANQQFQPKAEKLKLKLQLTREKKVHKQLPFLREGIEKLLPLMEQHQVFLALENLPTWEAIPTEAEMMDLLRDYGNSRLRYWHDLGHGQIRENMGMINQERWLEKLQPFLIGMHVHDVMPPGEDHVMPPHGHIDFSRFKTIGASDIIRVIEPRPNTPREAIVEAHTFLKEAWGTPSPQTEIES